MYDLGHLHKPPYAFGLRTDGFINCLTHAANKSNNWVTKVEYTYKDYGLIETYSKEGKVLSSVKKVLGELDK